MTMNSIYFLCSGNSFRSQIAEGYAKKYLPNWKIQSAGVRAEGLDSRAVKIMAEDNVDISNQFSKVIDDDFMEIANVVITLCGEARDKCIIPKSSRWLHWPINDPKLISGSDDKAMNQYRDIRDDIKSRIIELADIINK